MRIGSRARSGAGAIAVALFVAVSPAWAEPPAPAPEVAPAESAPVETAEPEDTAPLLEHGPLVPPASAAESAAPEPSEAAPAEAEAPARSWNLDAPEAEDDAPSRRLRERLRERIRARHRPVIARPRVAPQPPEPPSFGELDRLVPANVRVSLAESWTRWAPGVEAVIARAWQATPESWRPTLLELRDYASAPGGRRVLLALLVLASAALALARLVRGRGDLVVLIAYPDDLRGSFSVTLASSKPRAQRQTRGEREARAKVSTRNEHHLVARETQFRGLRPGRYWVTLEGELISSSSDQIVEEPFDTQPVHVRSRDTQRLEFDLRPRSCPVEIKVVWDKQTVRESTVAARGRPDTLRHTRGQTVRIGLPIGRHVIAVGSGDRVAERELDVDSYSTQIVEVDLGNPEGVLFKGCPPAVAPYLAGDVQSAARALAREGQDKVSNFLLARMHLEQNNRGRAAEHFEYAEHFREAARLREELRDWAHAGTLYQKSGEPLRAGEMFQKAGELVRAGKAFELASDLERALACYREGGDMERVIGVLERRGETYEAAKLAREHDDRSRAIKLLQNVLPDDPNYSSACLMLADALEAEGHTDLAARKLQERLERAGEAGASPDLRDRLAELYEKSGEFGRAVDVLEKLRQDEPTWPNVATRLEQLRKRVSEARDTTPGRTVPLPVQPTQPAESRYELVEQIGRGGMGVVFRARDTRLGREVALKRLPENLRDHPAAVQLFLREARAAAALNHPNIVTVHDADQEGDHYFITMELLEGDPLHVLLKRAGRLSSRDCARLGAQICAGLEYAHERRVVHRDIKTSNLFFTRAKVVKIMDFGLAKMMEEVRRSATLIGGTPYYMAPEQAAGENVDARADLYALGVTFFELLTGSVPFRDGDVVYHHRHSPPPDPRQRAAGIPDGLAELILAMLVKDPARRIGSAAEVARRLSQFAT